MGANCCVAAKEKHLPETSLLEVSNHRNVRHSPSWSFRWDNRTHIEDILNNPARNSGNNGPEIKSEVTTETEGLSDRASPYNDLQTQKWQKSYKTGYSGMQKANHLSGHSIEGNSSPETAKSPSSARASDAKLTVAAPSNPPSAIRADPSSSRSRSLPSDPTSSRKARRSPGFQLSRQISDSRIPSLKSLNENSSPEGRQSCMLSVCSNDFSAGGSHDGSSDGWSMRTFTELVASSRRDRWSFDSENFLYNNSRGTKFDGQQSMAAPGPKTCKICSKQLKDRSPWSAQKIVSTNELPVVAILVCEHVYHADCLENMTHAGESYDPPCPICTYGEESVAKLFGKVEKARGKISRIAVVDPEADQDAFSDHQERTMKVPRMGASSSMKRPFSQPFLRRYFSMGIGRPSQSPLDNESSRKKSFWPRYRRS